MKRITYSVLMSVYGKEKPEYLTAAIESMLRQTAPPDEFVLVCDGPLTEGLEAVIERFRSGSPGLFHIIRFHKNRGLGPALNAGVRACKNPLIARMDSDDISVPRRCEWQLNAFEQDETLALLSGAIAEFDTDPEKPLDFRRLPLSQGEILRFSRRRNPMNHMAVMMKKEAALAAGNYGSWSGMEDYELWVQMLASGFQAANLEQVLVLARTGNGMMNRRGGAKYARDVLRLQLHFLKIGFLPFPQFLVNCAVRCAVSCVPDGARGRFYRNVLRKKVLRKKDVK